MSYSAIKIEVDGRRKKLLKKHKLKNPSSESREQGRASSVAGAWAPVLAVSRKVGALLGGWTRSRSYSCCGHAQVLRHAWACKAEWLRAGGQGSSWVRAPGCPCCPV
ncbi:hypothetical protein GOP47_0029574 [Adiantum capillus-veneris]|nr:hypothetical protein GOP47_0029574 [Adiantum capillus-veneris]